MGKNGGIERNCDSCWVKNDVSDPNATSQSGEQKALAYTRNIYCNLCRQSNKSVEKVDVPDQPYHIRFSRK